MSAEDQFVEEYRGLVRSIAMRTRDQFDLSADVDDLMAYGFEGLWSAKQRFDPERGVQFNTFAYYRIRGAILDGVRRSGYVSRRAYTQLRAAEAALELGERAGEERAAALQASRAGAAATTPEQTSATLRATVARLTASYLLAAVGQEEQETAPTAELGLIARERRTELRAALETLPEREAALVRGYYFEGRRFDHVAEELGISKSWASRLHQKALDRLKAALRDDDS